MVCKTRLDGYSCFADALTAISLHSWRISRVMNFAQIDVIDGRTTASVVAETCVRIHTASDRARATIRGRI